MADRLNVENDKSKDVGLLEIIKAKLFAKSTDIESDIVTLANLTRKHDKTLSEMNRQRNEIRMLNAKIARCNTKATDYAHEKNDLETRLNNIRTQLMESAKVKKELKDAEDTIDNYKLEEQRLLDERKTLERKHDNLVSQLNIQIDMLETNNRNLIAKQQQRVMQFQDTVNDLNLYIKRVTDKSDQLLKTIAKQEKKIQDMEKIASESANVQGQLRKVMTSNRSLSLKLNRINQQSQMLLNNLTNISLVYKTKDRNLTNLATDLITTVKEIKQRAS